MDPQQKEEMYEMMTANRTNDSWRIEIEEEEGQYLVVEKETYVSRETQDVEEDRFVRGRFDYRGDAEVYLHGFFEIVSDVEE